ncbi:protein of unknown function [Candidatus Hydrogenisulfobacillus filiaventi]|uniref:Uncharacterized protein n=1 Tax=Candidatus Hydrogenisulfobacillus filiaventi TaxID=2707344 RepID=A0A6F8ZE34_9FIRM|nr:protein of unknown function [Candidatus Hydrogenisulfobacillus filiaventi]
MVPVMAHSLFHLTNGVLILRFMAWVGAQQGGRERGGGPACSDRGAAGP